MSIGLACLVTALGAAVFPGVAEATPEEDLVAAPVQARSRDAIEAEVAVLRLRGLRERVDPSRLRAVVGSVAHDPAVVPSARALAAFAGSELRADLG